MEHCMADDETPTPTTLRQVMRDAHPFGSEDEKLLAMLGDMARGIEEDTDLASRGMLDECALLWQELQEEARAQREMQGRLHRELRQMQDRSEHQHEESADFMQRLASAKDALTEKVQASGARNAELSAHLRSTWRDAQRLACSGQQRLRGLAAKDQELQAEVWELSASQASLVAELETAASGAAELRAQLQTERHETWRSATETVMAFVGKEAAAEQELELEEVKLLETHLAEVSQWAGALGVKLALEEEDLESAIPVAFPDIQRHLAEIESLSVQLAQLEVRSEEAAADGALDQLRSEQREMSTLQAEMLHAEGRAEECRQDVQATSSRVSQLRGELLSEQAVLRQEEQAASRRRELFRAQVDERRKELCSAQQANQKIMEELKAAGCFKRKPEVKAKPKVRTPMAPPPPLLRRVPTDEVEYGLPP
ncbi:unnamed protein product [Effrenium voratum]|nr:unnamed protein product [Effrenium voratum]